MRPRPRSPLGKGDIELTVRPERANLARITSSVGAPGHNTCFPSYLSLAFLPPARQFAITATKCLPPLRDVHVARVGIAAARFRCLPPSRCRRSTTVRKAARWLPSGPVFATASLIGPSDSESNHAGKLFGSLIESHLCSLQAGSLVERSGQPDTHDRILAVNHHRSSRRCSVL
jgi:hypothetical protein